MESDSAGRKEPAYALLCAAIAGIAAGLVIYSQTLAFAWDEGFHLLAAQLIKGGKRPYIDFFFPQACLNAYWNSFWMRLGGESWHTAHAVAAVLAGCTVMLTADYVYTRFPDRRWRFSGALAAGLLTGLSIVVVQFATVGQAYGLCLFLIMAAFRASVAAVDRPGLALPLIAGLCAGAGAGSSLLTAPVGPVLLLWMLVYNRAGNRWVKSAAVAGGALIAVSPLLWLFSQAPHQFIFDVFKYHLLYRQVKWSGAFLHDAEALTAWADSSQAMLLGLLALAGLLFIRFRSGWQHSRRAEFYLCGWIPLALAVHLSTAHPTFERYFMFLVPFLSILAVAGFYSIVVRMYSPDRPLVPVIVLGLLMSLTLAKTLFTGRDDFKWRDLEPAAAKVDQVTPRDRQFLADEQTYFLTRRTPPHGMESDDSHKLEVPPAESARLHIVPKSEVDRRLNSKAFYAVETCADDEDIEKQGLPKLFQHREKVSSCTVLWDPKP